MTQESVILTGATGFLAAHLIPLLIENKFKITAIKRAHSSQRLKIDQSNVTWIDRDDAVNYVKENKQTAIIHLATDYGHNCDKAEVYRTNVEWPVSLLNAQMGNSDALFINTDTFFSKPQFNYAHMTDYIESKRYFLKAGEKAASENGNLKFISLRLEHVFGEYDNPEKFIPMIVRKMLYGVDEIKLTDGRQKRDFVYAGDVAKAYLAVLKNSQKIGSNFSQLEVGSGQSVPLRDFILAVANVVDCNPLRLKFGAIPHRKSEIMDSAANIRPLLALDYKIRGNYESALLNMIDYYRVE